MQYKSLLVVIPTRNRHDLAINAVNSVLNQENCNFEVIVSDNSTEEQEVEKLHAFCEKNTDSRLRYIRPPEPLPMTEHWDWAMGEALTISQASHIIYLTDRCLLKPLALSEIANIVNLYPEKTVSYSYDSINDIDSPVSSFQMMRTEKLFEVSSQDLLDLSAESFLTYSMPKMLNCCCPRETIEAIHKKYGHFFFSNSPDYNFAYTCLETEDSILFYDSPIMIGYGLNRSNGTTFHRGLFNKTKTTVDFIKTTKLNDISDNFIFKLPLSWVQHVAYEYELVKQLSGSSKFKELDETKFLGTMLSLVLQYEDNQEKFNSLLGMISVNKIKLPPYILKVYLIQNGRKLMRKLKIRVMSSDRELTLIKNHQSVDEAIDGIINHPRLVSSSEAFFKTRIGRSFHELKNK
jgi:glycosyltransferase involved in cell wall biosynthesis